ncbi:MAG: hypothetical protein QG633_158 [Patescibacteria group bacterium]|jgi:spore germination protein YaaH|nr:hypothetical protein [Patescibacteria group bacterium]
MGMKTITTHSTRYAAMMFVTVAFVLSAFPSFASAKDLEVSGWIPYWTSGAPKAAQKHIDDLYMIHPFGYALQSTGDIKDLMDIKKSAWKNLLKKADKEDVLIVPTITTSNGSLVHTILSDSDLRKDHIKKILAVVKKQKFDGIDIDYEGKLSMTKDYYSLFLKELKKGLGKKILSCTIEARTPPEDLYRVVPADIAYANDYEAIAQYCDRVNIMAYDQQRADITLNDANKGEPYIPVSDDAWVRKVLDFTLQTIPKNKVVLGIATYGHEYEVLVTPNQYTEYRRAGAYNLPGIEKKIAKYDIEPSRTKAGELGFSYSDLMKHAPQFITNFSIPANTPESLKVAARSLAYSNATGNVAVFQYVTWSDAQAMKDKIDLAKEFDLRGVALFKIDGQEDQDVWEEFE